MTGCWTSPCINSSRTAPGGTDPRLRRYRGSFALAVLHLLPPPPKRRPSIAATPQSPMASPPQDVETEAYSRLSSTTAERPLLGGGGAVEDVGRVGAGNASAAYGEGFVPSDEAKQHLTAQAAVPAPLASDSEVEQRRPAQAAVPAAIAGAGRGDLLWELQGFSASAAPARISYFEGGAWRELPPAAVQLLREGFLAGRSVVEVSVGGTPCMFDFVRMVQIDVATAAQKPIAWNNAHGRLFYPKLAAGAGPKKSDRNGGAASPAAGGPLEEHWDENNVITCPSEVDKLRWEGLQELVEGDQAYVLVEKLFLESMARSVAATRITSIRRCSNRGASGKARSRVFQMWEQMTKAARGTANVRYGWYGDSAARIASVVAHGFGQPNNRAMRPAAQAVGVYMAPAYSPLASLSMSVPDHAGEHHVLLCRVILGSVEAIDMDSPRHHPTGVDFDSGVDHLEKPGWYIVWPTHMNTHILPEFVVSFKTSEAAAVPGGIRRGPQQRTPSRAQLTFEKLFAELGDLLPASRVHAMETLFNHFKAGKLTKGVFVKNMAAIGGPKLLAIARRFNK
ncbi:hypothetical protein Taro_019351 [Colocasia esculenta]|uniref:Poly [ADP-ribose] polymerase n=1 Tax=Colocasia esculenta TaxID=4460 RepID=A0A843UKW4_COLES|nr:hypothetical protein [Colocasia esculenta]